MCREENTRELLAFLDKSPSAFHAVENMKNELVLAGYEEKFEEEEWELEVGKGYFTTRNGSALIAFVIPKKDYVGYQIMASHSDSPTFKIKTNPEMVVENKYVKLNIEKYGGMICSTWLDRPLSIAGRVVVSTDNGIESKLIHVDQDLLMIPNLAIHMNRGVNEGYEWNAQKDLLPLVGGIETKGAFAKLIADEAGVDESEVLDTDLFLYNRMKGTLVGIEKEFICSGRLDDLQCAYASLKGLLKSNPTDSVAVHCVMDNEEVGSGTKQGAASTFLKDVLQRINASLGRNEEQYHRAISSSFMVSADNAHGVHPNLGEKADPTNRPFLNEGIVIKYSANQKYTTDAISGGIFRALCKKAEVPVQTFANRSDIIGGSTLGNVSTSQVPLNTVDIGLAQLGMHSAYETGGAKDAEYLIQVAEKLFSSSIRVKGNTIDII